MNWLAARTKELSDSNEELQKMYQQLVKLDLAKEEFITMVNHELKTPLTPIKAYGEILLRETKGSLNDKQKKAVHAIVRNTERLELLVTDVMDVYKLDMKRMKLSKINIPVLELVNRTINDARSLGQREK